MFPYHYDLDLGLS